MAFTPDPTLISGGTGTGNIQSVRRPLDISNDIVFYNPNANPFMLLAQKANKKASIDPEFKVLEAQIQPIFDNINNAGGYNTTATSIVVDNGSYFKAQDLVQVTRTKEIFKISSVSSNTLTVVRGYGVTSGTAIVDDDELRRLGNAFEEGAAVDVSKTVQVDSITNYLKYLETLTSNGKMQSGLYAGNPLELELLIAAARAIANSENIQDWAISRQG